MTFSFRQRAGTINLRLISSLDVQKIIETANIVELQSVLDTLSFSHFTSTDVQNNTIESVANIILLLQLLVEYLLYSQENQCQMMNSLYARCEDLKKALKQALKDNTSLKEDTKIYQNQLSLMKKSLHKSQKLVKTVNKQGYTDDQLFQNQLLKREGNQIMNETLIREIVSEISTEQRKRYVAETNELMNTMAGNVRQISLQFLSQQPRLQEQFVEQNSMQLKEFSTSVERILRVVQSSSLEAAETLSRNLSQLVKSIPNSSSPLLVSNNLISEEFLRNWEDKLKTQSEELSKRENTLREREEIYSTKDEALQIIKLKVDEQIMDLNTRIFRLQSEQSSLVRQQLEQQQTQLVSILPSISEKTHLNDPAKSQTLNDSLLQSGVQRGTASMEEAKLSIEPSFRKEDMNVIVNALEEDHQQRQEALMHALQQEKIKATIERSRYNTLMRRFQEQTKRREEEELILEELKYKLDQLQGKIKIAEDDHDRTNFPSSISITQDDPDQYQKILRSQVPGTNFDGLKILNSEPVLTLPSSLMNLHSDDGSTQREAQESKMLSGEFDQIGNEDMLRPFLCHSLRGSIESFEWATDEADEENGQDMDVDIHLDDLRARVGRKTAEKKSRLKKERDQGDLTHIQHLLNSLEFNKVIEERLGFRLERSKDLGGEIQNSSRISCHLDSDLGSDTEKSETDGLSEKAEQSLMVQAHERVKCSLLNLQEKERKDSKKIVQSDLKRVQPQEREMGLIFLQSVDFKKDRVSETLAKELAQRLVSRNL